MNDEEIREHNYQLYRASKGDKRLLKEAEEAADYWYDRHGRARDLVRRLYGSFRHDISTEAQGSACSDAEAFLAEKEAPWDVNVLSERALLVKARALLDGAEQRITEEWGGTGLEQDKFSASIRTFLSQLSSRMSSNPSYSESQPRPEQGH